MQEISSINYHVCIGLLVSLVMIKQSLILVLSPVVTTQCHIVLLGLDGIFCATLDTILG